MQKTKIRIKKPAAPQKSAFTAILYREDDGYVATCPELDVASQGMTVEEATANLTEAVELFLKCADPKEIDERLLPEILVTRIEARHG
jgi:predicted RNase H-like HicB family nuclease